MDIIIKCKDWEDWYYLKGDPIMRVGDLFQNVFEGDGEALYQVTHVWFAPDNKELEQHVVVKRTKLRVPM